MKRVLILLIIISSFKASAQQPWIIPKNKLKSFVPFYQPLKKDSLQPIFSLNKWMIPQAKYSHTLPDNTKVYLLPLDNMICLVPDMNQFNMPNAFALNDSLHPFLKPGPGKIPNPIIPYQIIPDGKEK